MDAVTTADGVDIFYKDWGPKDAQPLVFHHGWPLSADDWDAQLLYFGVSFSLIGRPINILADLGNILICVSRLYIDNQTLPIRRSNQPPVRESRRWRHKSLG